MTDCAYHRRLLDKARYLNVASITINDQGDLEPHCTVVFFHATSKALFWTSARSSQHSKNLLLSTKAFVTVFEENLKEGTGAGKGLYLSGTVSTLSDANEIHAAKTLSTEKANRDREENHKLHVPDSEGFRNQSARAVYCFTPQKVWTNTWSRETGDARLELDVKEIFANT